MLEFLLTFFLASSNFSHLLITFANSLDPDQDQQNVGPDLDPTIVGFDTLTVFLKEFLKEVGRRQQMPEKLPGIKRDNK